MKSKSVKYEEAVQRNLKVWFSKSSRKGRTLEQQKHGCGVKQSDIRFDTLFENNI